MSIFKESYFKEIGITEEEFEREAKKITVKGYRLTFEEKQEILFALQNGFIRDGEIGRFIDMQREDKEEIKQMHKNIKKMAKAAEDYAVKEYGWNRKDFKNTYDMVEILEDNLEVALDYWEAYGEQGGAYYLRTYV